MERWETDSRIPGSAQAGCRKTAKRTCLKKKKKKKKERELEKEGEPLIIANMYKHLIC